MEREAERTWIGLAFSKACLIRTTVPCRVGDEDISLNRPGGFGHKAERQRKPKAGFFSELCIIRNTQLLAQDASYKVFVALCRENKIRNKGGSALVPE